MKQEVASFLDYVAHSPTVFQATQQACDMLDAAGFTRLSEHEAWEILPGGRYYVTRNRSALVAFAVPENGFTHCQIVASHGDSPTFKLKAHAEGEAAGAYIRLDVEPYGGMIMSTWFDRPLSIAGRALVREDGRLVTRLIDLDRDAALIPNMRLRLFGRRLNVVFRQLDAGALPRGGILDSFKRQFHPLIPSSRSCRWLPRGR